MKNHSSGYKKAGTGYRTPSVFRANANGKLRNLQAKWLKKK
ncbi:MAG: hypothetical protein AAB692_05715 [Patescibacteria group bacterium]